MIYFKWIAEHRGAVMLLIFACGAICQYINYRHMKDGRAKPGDLGYFWRIWRDGEIDGKIMIYATFSALFLAFILIISLIIKAKY